MERFEKNKQTAFLPPLNKRVIVQCEKARCLAYLDTSGHGWKMEKRLYQETIARRH